ncbi:MAG: tetratricopeptide repeat protein [Spirochaetaceae bacterium]|jgi:tetratricopeptide (TPR) repeat protein|nr:tetratricopeptide repeat protein [Spirochaetaceae bacterium]
MMYEDSEKLNIRAIEFASSGKFIEAIACFKRAITIDAMNYLLWYNLGITYRDAGDLRKAKDALECAYRLTEGDEEIIETLALVCFTLADFDEAFDYYSEALDINDANARCWNNMGVLFFNRNDYLAACDAFERAVCISPYYYDALFNLRDTYHELGNRIGAAECVRRLSEL